LCIDADEPSVRLVHRRGPPDDRTERLLASDVDVARSRLAQARGLMFRRSIPEEYALVFPFDGVESRTLHMLFVPFAIDAVWLVDDEVTATARLSPFVGLGRGDADTVVELPTGAADAVAVGDEVVISGDEA
jgi:uncharacterized membrane protein (UPF0127 family)